MWRQELRAEGRSCMEPMGRNISKLLSPKRGEREEGTENMLELHAQLQQETENIVRWKASTEVNTKQLERQLDEARVTLADQRRNLMELQLNSETLSQGLLRERQERQMIENKVSYTRQIFLTLEQQKEELSTTLSLLEQDKEFLSAGHNDILKKLTELTNSFHYLCEIHKQKVDSLSAQAKSEANELRDKNASQEQEIDKLNTALSQLLQSQTLYEERLSKLTELLGISEDRLSCAQQEIAALESSAAELKSSLETTQNEKEENKQVLSAQLSKLQENLAQEQYRRIESQGELAEAIEKIQFLENLNDTLEGSKSEILGKLEAVMIQKQELEEELVQRNDHISNLQAQHSEMAKEATVLSETLTDIRVKYSELELAFQNVQSEKQSLVMQLSESDDQLHREQEAVHRLTEKVSEVTQELDNSSRTVEELKVDLQTLKEENNEMRCSIEQLNRRIQEADSVGKSKDEFIADTENKVKTLEEHINSLNDQLTNIRNEWTSDNQSYEQRISDICARAAETETELKNQIYTIDNEHKKTASEKDNVTEEWKEQQTFIKSQKAQLKEQEKELKCKVKALAQETKKKEKAEASLMALEKKFQNMEEAQKVLQALLQETLNDKEQAQNVNEGKQKVLEDNLQSKEKEITELQDLNRTTENELKETQQKFCDAQETLDASLKELNELREKFQAKVKEIEELENNSDKTKRELEEKGEQLTTSFNVCEQLQGDVASLKRCMGEQRSKYAAEIQGLKESLEEARKGQKQAKQEVVQINKEKEDIMVEADTKVKDMLGIIERYRSDNELKMKKVTKKLLEAQQKLAKKEEDIANVSSANTKLLAEAVVRTTSVASKKEKKTYQGISDAELTTPSPRQYLSHCKNKKLSPDIPAVQPTPVSKFSEEQSIQETRSHSSILKIGAKRILVPPSEQKRVVFKSPLSFGRHNEEDSSSDATAYELDDSFDEMVKSRKRKSNNIPCANIIPTVCSKEPNGGPLPLSTVHKNINQEQNDESPKKVYRKVKSNRHSLRTYSAVSPRRKQVDENQQPAATVEAKWKRE